MTACWIWKTYSVWWAFAQRVTGFQIAVAAAPYGGTRRRRTRASGNCRRRGGHRHRKDFRISRTRVAVRGASPHFNRTRTLQDPAVFKDLPLVAAALGRPARIALLKGRTNYLCRYRLAQVGVGGEQLSLATNSFKQPRQAWLTALTSTPSPTRAPPPPLGPCPCP